MTLTFCEQWRFVNIESSEDGYLVIPLIFNRFDNGSRGSCCMSQSALKSISSTIISLLVNLMHNLPRYHSKGYTVQIPPHLHSPIHRYPEVLPQDLVLVTPATLDTRVLSPALLLIELLVKLDSSPSYKESRKNSQSTSKKEETTSHSVERLLATGIEVGAEPVADLADTVGNGDKSGLLCTRGGYNCGLPRELQVETVVGTADKKDNTDVASSNVDCSNEDTATSCR